jgi:hypothetical protein
MQTDPVGLILSLIADSRISEAETRKENDRRKRDKVILFFTIFFKV